MGDPNSVKVVHLITLLEFGGAQGNTIHTVQNINPNHFDAFLWAGKGAYWDAKARDVTYIRTLVRSIHPILDVLALFELWWRLRRFKPMILHTHSSKAGILGRIAGRLAGVPQIIHSYHGFGFNDRQSTLVRNVYIALERWTAGMAQKLIFVSESNRETARKLRIGKEDQYCLIRSGVPLKKIKQENVRSSRAQIRAEFSVPEDASMVMTIGAFKPQKNLKDFLLAARKIKDRFPSAHFFLLGDGVLRKELEETASHLRLTDCLHLPGWREDAIRFLAASDIFVMTSLWEGLPRALVEAMACGLPSVCYATDGVSDLLSAEEETLIPQGDVEGLSRRVIELIENKAEWTRVSNQISSKIGVDFDIDEMVKQQEALYEQLLNKCSK